MSGSIDFKFSESGGGCKWEHTHCGGNSETLCAVVKLLVVKLVRLLFKAVDLEMNSKQQVL